MDAHASGPAPTTRPVRSSELLGFPPGARVLIVNNDDFGTYPAINAAVVDSIERGIASSCSLMVPCPGAPQAISLLRRHRGISFGIHLTLVCDTASCRWGPVTAKDKVSSLLVPRRCGPPMLPAGH
jgi:chitin disaccharide deacetylase